jgi:YegS/Rv2252/BmrU family lipid kinase
MPESRDFVIIANPTAGIGAGKSNRLRLLEAAQHDLEKHGHRVEVLLESDPSQVSALAEKAARSGCCTVIAAGGDGTVNAVVNGMMRVAEGQPPVLKDVTLGVLPLGTGNVFAFNLNIGRTWREACKVLRAGNVRVIDVGMARSTAPKSKASNAQANAAQSSVPICRHFVLMAGIGFDAKVIEETSLRLKFVLRDFAYALKSLQNAVLHQGTQVTLKFPNGKIFADEAWLVIVGNAASYAWDIKVTGRARLDDGLIDVCLLPYENKLFSVQQAMMMLIGQHVERGTAHYWKVRSVRIESKPPVPIQLDGDEWAYTPVEISVLPGALRVLAPPE